MQIKHVELLEENLTSLSHTNIIDITTAGEVIYKVISLPRCFKMLTPLFKHDGDLRRFQEGMKVGKDVQRKKARWLCFE